jgi:hypothetical protein
MEESTKCEQVRAASLALLKALLVRPVELTNLRYGFLLNRYVVPTMLGVVFYGAPPMSPEIQETT